MSEVFVQIQNLIYITDRVWMALFSIIFVIFFGFLTGPVKGRALPLFWQVMHVLFTNLGKRLYKTERSVSDLVFRGMLLTLFAFVISLGCGYLARAVSVVLPFWGVTEVFFLSCLLTSGTVFRVLLKLHETLKTGSAGKGAYYSLALSTNTNLNSVDDFGITRAGMGFAARSFDKALVGPVFWYVIGGLPLAFVYAGLAYLSWEIGKDGHTKGFGKTVNILEKLFGFLPHVFAGLFLALACVFTPTAWLIRALGGFWSGQGRAPYYEGGYPLSVMAYGLGVSLGGPVTDLSGTSLRRRWVGPKNATAQLESGHLKRTLYMLAMANLLFWLFLLGGLLFIRLS